MKTAGGSRSAGVVRKSRKVTYYDVDETGSEECTHRGRKPPLKRSDGEDVSANKQTDDWVDHQTCLILVQHKHS